MIISLGRVDRQGNCLYGRTVIERESILDLKLNVRRKRVTHRSRSREQGLTILNERNFPPIVC